MAPRSRRLANSVFTPLIPPQWRPAMTDRHRLPDRRHVIAGLGASSLVGLSGVAARAQDAAEVPIGMVLPFSGATGPYRADMKKAADIVVKIINDGGGILCGRRLHLYIEDSETNPAVGVTAARQLLAVNKVELGGGFRGSPSPLAAKPPMPAANQG